MHGAIAVNSEARVNLDVTLFERVEMNSAILSLLNGEYQELVLSFSTEGGILRGVLQSPTDIRINYARLSNTGSA
jgi:hypothetical protein